MGSLPSGILWEVSFGLNVLTLIYIGKRKWTFEDVKAKDGKKSIIFFGYIYRS